MGAIAATYEPKEVFADGGGQITLYVAEGKRWGETQRAVKSADFDCTYIDWGRFPAIHATGAMDSIEDEVNKAMDDRTRRLMEDGGYYG